MYVTKAPSQGVAVAERVCSGDPDASPRKNLIECFEGEVLGGKRLATGIDDARDSEISQSAENCVNARKE
jgi:hypothetical protein